MLLGTTACLGHPHLLGSRRLAKVPAPLHPTASERAASQICTHPSDDPSSPVDGVLDKPRLPAQKDHHSRLAYHNSDASWTIKVGAVAKLGLESHLRCLRHQVLMSYNVLDFF